MDDGFLDAGDLAGIGHAHGAMDEAGLIGIFHDNLIFNGGAGGDEGNIKLFL